MERATRGAGVSGNDEATLPSNGEETEPSASAGPQEEPLPVRVGRYPVLRKLGQGGMGVVLSAYDEELDRRVAIKLIRRAKSSATERLRREAQAMAKVSHPNVAHVYEVGSWNDQIFVAMEFVQGQTLGRWLKQERSREEVLDVLTQAGRGLVAAHEAKLVHRDFKPDNVMVGPDGRARVLDFGLAGATGAERPTELEDLEARHRELAVVSALDSPLTETGTLLGTPAYMSPEQFRSLKAGPASDQFSFCVTAYEALYGARPFSGNTVITIAVNVIKGNIEDAPSRSDVPASIRAVLLRGLASDPAERFPDMRSLLEALERSRGGSSRGWRLAAGVGLAAIVPVVIALAPGPEQTAAPCSGARGEFEQVWNAERAAQVRDALAGVDVPYAEASATRVIDAFDAYGHRWQAAHTDTCEDSEVRHEQSPDQLDRRMGCLKQALGRLDALATALEGVDENTMSKAVAAAQSLSDPARCEMIAQITADIPPPEPEVADEVARIRKELATADAMHVTGRYAEGWELAVATEKAAIATEYPYVTAEAALRVGYLGIESRNYDEGERGLRAAFFDGRRLGHDEVSAAASVRLVRVIGLNKKEREAALEWGEHAKAEVERIDDDLRRAELLYNLGTVLYDDKKHDRALDMQREALRIRERELGSEHMDTGKSHMEVGINLVALGDWKAGIDEVELAFGILQEALGDAHPDMAMAYTNMAGTLANIGREAEALPYFEKAAVAWERSAGPTSSYPAGALSSAATMASAAGMHERAHELYDRAIEVYARADDRWGPEGVRRTRCKKAIALLDTGDAKAAVEQLEALIADVPEDNLRGRYEAESALGRGLAQLGRFDEAWEAFDRATKLLEEDDIVQSMGASLHFEHGRARELAGEHDEARRLVELAIATLPPAPESGDDRYAAARKEWAAWLKAH